MPCFSIICRPFSVIRRFGMGGFISYYLMGRANEADIATT